MNSLAVPAAVNLPIVPPTYGERTSMKILSTSRSVCVFPSGCIGVCSSVTAPSTSTSSVILPLNCSLRPLWMVRSLLDPTVKPRPTYPERWKSRPNMPAELSPPPLSSAT